MAELPDKEIVRLFEGLRAKFPGLTMELHRDHPHVDVLMDIRAQDGLAFGVSVYLVGDELHLTAGHFWLEWFPCDRPAIREAYREAVVGVLSGSYRILEHHVGGRAAKAQLQRPEANEWQTIGTWANLLTLVPWPRRKKVLQNVEVRGAE